MRKARKPGIIPPPFSQLQIIRKAEQLIDDFLRIVGPKHIRLNGLRFEDIYETIIKPRYKIKIIEGEDLGFDDETGRRILGIYDALSNVAHIDVTLASDLGDPRRTFTLWHEVGGHGVLQGDWLRAQARYIVTITEDSLSADTVNRLERQANIFAANAGAPAWLVRQVVQWMIPERQVFPFRSACQYFLNVQGLQLSQYVADFNHLCSWIGRIISGFFGGMSHEALGYRLAELGIVVHQSPRRFRLYRRAA